MEEKKEITLFDYLNVFYRHRFFILIVFVITTLAAFIFTKLASPQYVTTAVVKLSLKETKLSVLPEVYTSIRTVDPVQSQLEVMRSKALAEKVVMMLGLNMKFDFGTPGVKVDTAWTDERVIPGEYTLKFDDNSFWVIDPEERVLGRGRIGELFSGQGLGFRLILSPGANAPRYGRLVVVPASQIAPSVARMFRVRQKGETNLAIIQAQGTDPVLVARAANALAQAYVDYSLYGVIEEARITREFLEGQLDKVLKELRKAEDELRAFKEKEGIYLMDEAARALVKRIANLESKLAEAEANREEARRKLENLRAQLEGKYGTFAEYRKIASSPEVGSNPLVRSLREKLASLEVKKARLLEKYTFLHPEVEAVEREIQSVKKQLEKAVQDALKVGPSADDPILRSIISGIIESETRMNAEEGKIQALKKMIAKYRSELKTYPKKEVEFAELTRRVEALRSTYNMLLSKLEEAKIAEAKKTSEAKIIDRAGVPTVPVKPNKTKNILFGALLGFVLGFTGAFLLEYIDVSVKTPEEVEDILDVQVLATIPFIKKGVHPSHKLITHLDSKSPAVEAYRALKTSLKFLGSEPPRSVVMTSSVAGEGKTLTASNLAIVLADTGNRVILVDADLRNPNIDVTFNIGRTPGLREYVDGRANLKEVVYPLEIKNLSIIPSGEIPDNPLEYIDNPRFKELLDRLKNDYDFVILDAPPLLPVTDAFEIADKSDGLILVVRAGETERPVLREARKRIKRAKVRLLGAVLNAVVIQKHYGYYYPYDTLYYYGYGSKKKKIV